MELCPICKRMTAERSHYTGILICYAVGCYPTENKQKSILTLYDAEKRIKELERRFDSLGGKNG